MKYPKAKPIMPQKSRNIGASGSNSAAAGSISNYGSYSASGNSKSPLAKRLFNLTFPRHPKIVANISDPKFRGI